ncbi:hypothetical protein NDU88_003766 [Pleurodeles waltl]|uniref:VWF/SSPO/Zonadhesin-like cysteine-rich domain-containing protein n=1 Tax=Pleurodeles waltl TaxID=8319 RepID=A0AAV7TPZ2_PLEWA|nr:hypothetical protein NDU88_003766 [Pleurodeles waltl]
MFTFRDAQFKVEDTRIGKRVPYKIRYMGIYLVVEGSNGMILLWDKKTTIFVKLTTVFTVNPVPYYDVCVTDSCACDIGGDCECFCTAVAAYAQACSDNGICVNWRSPEICRCYPRCPTERPFYDEDRKQCVAKCGCYDDEENRYEFGEKVDLCVSCQIW